jgi:hypothetical protein
MYLKGYIYIFFQMLFLLYVICVSLFTMLIYLIQKCIVARLGALKIPYCSARNYFSSYFAKCSPYGNFFRIVYVATSSLYKKMVNFNLGFMEIRS